MEAGFTLQGLEELIDNQYRDSGVAPTDMWLAPDAKRELDKSLRSLIAADYQDWVDYTSIALDTGIMEITVRPDLPPGTIFLFNREDMPDDFTADQD
jgi:hypothetical protein